MKIVIAGAGAIGGYIGAKLAKAGADVVLFARGPHLRAMQERGLRVISPDGDFEVPVNATGDLASIGQADVVFLGVKAHGLTALAPTLRPLFGADTVVVSTQNGIPWWYFQGIGGEREGLRLERVDPGGVIAGAIELRRVIGSLAYFATDIVAFCKERLADFKRPKQVHITQAIPRTATGKIQRGAVAKAYSGA